MLLAGIERVAQGVARTAGLPEELYPEVAHGFESTPTTSNDPELVARIRGVFRAAFGEEGMFEHVRQGMGAEDFAYFVQTADAVPGAYFSVGGTLQEELAYDDAASAAAHTHTPCHGRRACHGHGGSRQSPSAARCPAQ